MKERIIDFLLNNADASIVLRIKKEILNDLSKKEENELLYRIIPQKNVQIVIQSQKPDGWFGNGFHGQSPKSGVGMYDNMEVGLRYLSEKGFPLENEYIFKAIHSFLVKKPFDSAYGGKAPTSPDTDYTYTACGLYLARSSIIIRAGYELCLPKNDFINLSYDIDFSLKTFTSVLEFASIDEVLDTHRKKLCFKPNVLWPCIYHLRMLAHSHGWRNEKNISVLADSVNRLLSFTQSDDMVYTYKKGQYVGPCFALIHAQMKILEIIGDGNLSLDAMELFARCGIIKRVEALKNKYEYMLSLVENDLKVNMEVNKRKRNGWSPYLGFALEEDWKTNRKLQYDLLFRILLIIHYEECTV